MPKVHEHNLGSDMGGLTNCLSSWEFRDGQPHHLHGGPIRLAMTSGDWTEACQRGEACKDCMAHLDRLAGCVKD